MGLLARLVKKRAPGCETKSGLLAIYDSKKAPPRTINIKTYSWSDLLDKLTIETHKECQLKGGSFPFVVLREIIENLTHAQFKDIVISVLADGHTVKISDQGPGIIDKKRVFEPGFTTATSAMKHYIKGVGSGLPVAKELLSFSGGTIKVEDNLSTGTVVTLCLKKPVVKKTPTLTDRQINILSLIIEFELAGPSDISKELGLSPSTVYRELGRLESLGLIKADSFGKRTPTAAGLNLLDTTINQKRMANE